MTNTLEMTEVLSANDAFYAAFRACDYGAMNTLWAQSHDVAVYHPGWPGIVGRAAVMESWHRIMMVGSPPPIRPHDTNVILNGSTAIVFCYEDLGTARTVATNTFVREDGNWRMSHHQAAGLPETGDTQ